MNLATPSSLLLMHSLSPSLQSLLGRCDRTRGILDDRRLQMTLW